MQQLLYQLADSAFPAGGFAHSAGLEALRACGHLRGERDLVVRLEELAWHTAYALLPFLGDAMRGDVLASDLACDVFLAGHVANRASRAQGRALLLAAEAMLDVRPELPCGHLPAALGAVLADRTTLAEARELAMFATLRGATSAAVRLGIVGPLRAQRVLHDLAATLERALAETCDLSAADACSLSPLIDVAQGGHDRLYARLFQS